MRSAVAVAIFLLAVAPVGQAASQEPTITDACVRVAELHFQDKVTEVSEVQAFPELSPPRVRLSIMRENARPTLTNPTPGPLPISCEFSAAAKPFGLVDFCVTPGCLDITADRLEELQVLLAREGL